MRVLVVEDEAKIASFVARAFEEESWETQVAANGEEGLAAAGYGSFDLLVLDVRLPGMDGFELLERLVKSGRKLPTIMLTARDSVSDRVRGLDLGADDYLAKPFSVEELLARARAITRRGASAGNLLRLADLELDRSSHRVFRGGKEIDLTRREYALLEYLLMQQGRVATRTMISERVWGLDFDTGTNTIDVYIKYLRDKIDAGFPLHLIKTVRGRGYAMSAEP